MMKRSALFLAASLMLSAAPALAQEEGAGAPAGASSDVEGQNELNLVVGENKTINATHDAESPVGIVQIKDGKKVFIGTVEPEM